MGLRARHCGAAAALAAPAPPVRVAPHHGLLGLWRPATRGQRRATRNPATLSFYDKTVEQYASQQPLHVTPEYVVNYSKTADKQSLLLLSRFLHKELPVRLARTLRDFQALPYIVGVNPHIEKIYAQYGDTFGLLIEHPIPDTLDRHESFCQLMATRLKLHADVISNFSKGIKDVRMLPDSTRIDFRYVDTFLDRALVQRIGRRVLGELLLVLHHKATTQRNRPNQFGVYSLVKPSNVVANCMSQVLYLASETYSRTLDYEIVGDTECELLCIASHLEYILFELCKNAVRATLDRFPDNPEKITFRICKGDAVTIVISDKGGGIADTGQAGSYGYSTASPSAKDNEYYRVKYSSSEESPPALQFAGFGFGLPLSRVYSRFSGGNLSYQTLPGYGTDMYLTVPQASSKTYAWEEDMRIGVFDDHCVDTATPQKVSREVGNPNPLKGGGSIIE